MKSGSLTTTLYGIVGEILPNPVLYVMAQSLTFIGVWLFISKILRQDWITTRNIFALTEISAAFRENLVDIQITGHILLLLSIGVLLWEKFNETKDPIYRYASHFSFLFAIDLKPNLTIVFVLVFLLTSRAPSNTYIELVCIFLSLYVALGLFTKTNLLIEWSRVLLLISDGSKSTDIYGSVSIWQILNNFQLISRHLSVISIVVFAVVACMAFLLVKIHRNEKAIQISILAPFFYSFFQFYSFTPIVALLLVVSLNSKRVFFFGYIVGQLTIIQGLDGSTNQALLIIIFVSTVFLFEFQKNIRNIRKLFTGFVVGLMINILSAMIITTNFERISDLSCLVILIYFTRLPARTRTFSL
jgi:hypothetical protein